MKKISLFFFPLFSLCFCGCVDIRQVIQVNHDGSGKIVEHVSLRPRGERMMQGAKWRTGQDKGSPLLLSEEEFQKRLKSMGEVQVESKKTNTLPDGRKQLETVYTFKDINKITLWGVPTMSYQGKNLDGKIKFGYSVEPRESWGKIMREELKINQNTADGRFAPRQPLSPAERQKFEQVSAIFSDMLTDFHLSIEIVAPIEDFEESDMVYGLPRQKNRLSVLKIDGENVGSASGFISQFIRNEVNLGEIQRTERGTSHHGQMPGVHTLWNWAHYGFYARFMKSEMPRK